MNPTSLVFITLLSSAAAFQPSPISSSLISRRVSSTSTRSIKLNALTNNQEDEHDNTTILERRSFCTRSLATLTSASILTTAFTPTISYAAESSALKPYDDTDYGFTVSVPATWENTEQKLSGRRKGIFFTDPNSKDVDTDTIETLAFIAYTPLRDDYTSLASFGSVDQVAQTTILPKSDLAGLKDTSQMLSATSKNNAYYFDYITTPVVPTSPGSGDSLTKTLKPQHFRSIFTMLPLKGAAGLTLVTITLQTSEERYGDVKGVFDSVIDSFGKVK